MCAVIELVKKLVLNVGNIQKVSLFLLNLLSCLHPSPLPLLQTTLSTLYNRDNSVEYQLPRNFVHYNKVLSYTTTLVKNQI